MRSPTGSHRWDFGALSICFDPGGHRYRRRPRFESYGREGWCVSWAWLDIGMLREAAHFEGLGWHGWDTYDEEDADDE